MQCEQKKITVQNLHISFLALAESQSMQAQRFLMQIRGTVGKTNDNETTTFERDLPRALEEYKELAIEAEHQGFKALATGFRHSSEVDKILLELHTRQSDQQSESNYFICDFCGYVTAEEPPDNCPICTAPKKRFYPVDAA